jgi:hypothetical protein
MTHSTAVLIFTAESGIFKETQRWVRVFEKVQKAVKNRVAAIGTPVHQPMHELPGLSRWREKLPMDCRYGFVSATESREKRAVHRAPRSAIHARNFASPIGA